MSCALTRILRDACGGSSRTAVLVTLSPRVTDTKITMHSLQFAHSVCRVQNHSEYVEPHMQPSIIAQFGLRVTNLDADDPFSASASTAASSAPSGDPLARRMLLSPSSPHPGDASVLSSSSSSSPVPPIVRRWSKIRSYVPHVAVGWRVLYSVTPSGLSGAAVCRVVLSGYHQ